MEIRLKASKTVKFSTQQEADFQLQTISDSEEDHSVALLADPLCEKISLGTDLKSDKISYLSCSGDSEESGSVLDFSWVQDLRRQCISLDIPFYFTGTGSNFRMRGRDFHIDKKFQSSQAGKAEMNYFPLSRAMNPPVLGAETDDLTNPGFHDADTFSPSKISGKVQNTDSFRRVSYHDTGYDDSWYAENSFRTASDDLRALGFRSVNASDSFNPFLEETASSENSAPMEDLVSPGDLASPENSAPMGDLVSPRDLASPENSSSASYNPFVEEVTKNTEMSPQSEVSEAALYKASLSGSELRIPHINYDIEIEDESKNEFLPDISSEETMTIPGINYEVTVEQTAPETAENSGFDCSTEVSEGGGTGSDEEALSQDFKGQSMDELFSHLQKSRFRSGFHLHKLERDYFTSHGEEVIRKHAADFIAQRLAPAEPANDGKQTPMKGHPVFIAQHATACCCRGCLKKWHHIPEHRALTEDEKNYVVNVLMAWIKRDISAVPDKKDKQSFERSKLN